MPPSRPPGLGGGEAPTAPSRHAPALMCACFDVAPAVICASLVTHAGALARVCLKPGRPDRVQDGAWQVVLGCPKGAWLYGWGAAWSLCSRSSSVMRADHSPLQICLVTARGCGPGLAAGTGDAAATAQPCCSHAAGPGALPIGSAALAALWFGACCWCVGRCWKSPAELAGAADAREIKQSLFVVLAMKPRLESIIQQRQAQSCDGGARAWRRPGCGIWGLTPACPPPGKSISLYRKSAVRGSFAATAAILWVGRVHPFHVPVLHPLQSLRIPNAD